LVRGARVTGRKLSPLSLKAQAPAEKNITSEDKTMRKLIAIMAALGFLGATSLTPVVAAASVDKPATSDEVSAQKKAKKAKKAMKKKAKKAKKAKKPAKKRAKKPMKKKADAVILYRIAA
jgi:hypothetical protein